MITNRKLIIIALVLFLVVGFATVATNLVLKGNFTLAANTADFDVSFSSAILDGTDVSSSAISADGKTLTFSSGELVYVDDVSILEYTVVNNSKQYDVNVAMECSAVNSSYVAVTNDFNHVSIPARSEVSGVLTATLVNASITDHDVSVSCTLVADSTERTEIGSDEINTNNAFTFSMYGTLNDENGNALANQALVIYSNPTYVVTDANGYFYVEGLEKGTHEIYVMGNKTLSQIQNMTESDVKTQAVTKSSFTTGSLNIVFENGYRIGASTIERTKKFTVKFDIDGGSTAVSDREVTRGLTYGELPTQTRAGYTFLGYYDPDDNKIESDTIVTQRKAHRVKVKWQANEYVVTLNADGGVFSSTEDWTVSGSNLIKNLLYDKAYGSLPKTTRLGYKFLGWYLNDILIETSTVLTQTENHVLVAKWELLKVDIVAYANGGTIASTAGWTGMGVTSLKSVPYNDVYGTLPIVTRAGYTFLGWYLGSGEKITSSTQMLKTDAHSIIAKWDIIEYTVNLNANGGSVSPASIGVVYQGLYEDLPTPTKIGNNFLGWYYNGNLVSSSSVNNNLQNHTLTAEWELSKYTITLNSNGGTIPSGSDWTGNGNIASKRVTYSNTYGNLPTPTRTGYNFLGWYDATSGGNKITDSSVVSITDNKSYYAQWKLREVVETIYLDGTKASSYPSSTSYSTFLNVSCTNGTVGTWNASNWKVTYPQYSDDTCSVYFSSSAALYIMNLASTNTSQMSTGDPDGNARYFGANPSNYISFNGETWRIIGAFKNIDDGTGNKETRLKIVRATSIGASVYDLTTYNGGRGANEWSTSRIMNLLNTTYYNKGSAACYYSNVNENISSSAGTKTCNYSSNGMNASAKNYIEQAVWNTGTTTNLWEDSANRIDNAMQWYSAERSSVNGKACTQGGSYCNDTITRKTTWLGMVGLMYPSDSGLATGGGSSYNRTYCTSSVSTYKWNSYADCYSNNWLYSSSEWQWTMTPARGSTSAAEAIRFSVDGNHRASQTNANGYMKPVVFLKAEVKFTGGNGTSGSLYQISL